MQPPAPEQAGSSKIKMHPLALAHSPAVAQGHESSSAYPPFSAQQLSTLAAGRGGNSTIGKWPASHAAPHFSPQLLQQRTCGHPARPALTLGRQVATLGGRAAAVLGAVGLATLAAAPVALVAGGGAGARLVGSKAALGGAACINVAGGGEGAAGGGRACSRTRRDRSRPACSGGPRVNHQTTPRALPVAEQLQTNKHYRPEL